MTEHKVVMCRIPIQENYTVTLPVGSKILDAIVQDEDEIIVFVLVAITEEDMSNMTVEFRIATAGEEIHRVNDYKYLKSVCPRGRLWYHIFYKG